MLEVTEILHYFRESHIFEVFFNARFTLPALDSYCENSVQVHGSFPHGTIFMLASFSKQELSTFLKIYSVSRSKAE